jgi:hypothetical protein
MTDLTLEARLVALGEGLEFPRADALVDDVLAELDQSGAPATPWRWRRVLLAAAAVLVIVVAVTLAVPGSRRAVARWFGFDGYRIERVVDLPDIDAAPAPVGPVIVRGDLTTEAFTKLVAQGTDVRRVSVNGLPGVWISGDDHLFFSYRRDGARREQRLAGNTLVWQEGDEIVRIEGDDLTLQQALSIAEESGG